MTREDATDASDDAFAATAGARDGSLSSTPEVSPPAAADGTTPTNRGSTGRTVVNG